MLEYWKRGLSLFAIFDGKDTPSEYWYFVLGNLMVYLGLLAILIVGIFIDFEPLAIGATISGLLYSLMAFIPSVCAAIRRMRDTDKSPYLLFLTFVPLGIIAVIILLAQPSKNRKKTYFQDEEEYLALPQIRYDEKDFV